MLLAPVARAKVQFEPAWGMAAWESTGAWLRATARPTDVVATDAAGVIALESNLRTIDVLGLADLHIAHLDVAIGSGAVGHEKSDPAYVLDRSPDFITTWIDDDGHIGRDFRRYFRFWRDYELRGLMRKDVLMHVSAERMMPIDQEPTGQALIALRNGKGPVPGKYSWAVWGRRGRPLPPRPFGRLDVHSQLTGALEHDGALMVATRGHPPGHVLHGPGMVFPPGRYRVSYDLEVRNAAASAPAADMCKFDIWDGIAASGQQTLTVADWQDRDGKLEAPFTVTQEAATRGHEFRLYCFGIADVTVRRGELASVDH